MTTDVLTVATLVVVDDHVTVRPPIGFPFASFAVAVVLLSFVSATSPRSVVDGAVAASDTTAANPPPPRSSLPGVSPPNVAAYAVDTPRTAAILAPLENLCQNVFRSDRRRSWKPYGSTVRTSPSHTCN